MPQQLALSKLQWMRRPPSCGRALDSKNWPSEGRRHTIRQVCYIFHSL